MQAELFTFITIGYALFLIAVRTKPEGIIMPLIGAASWLLHGYGLLCFLWASPPFLNLWVVLNLLFWIMLPAAYLVSIPLMASKRLLSPIAACILLVVFSYPWMASIPPWHLVTLHTIDAIHIVSGLVATAFLGIACLIAHVIYVRDDVIKHNPRLLLKHQSPPLQKLEHAFVAIIAIGFMALSTSIAIGFINLDNILEQKQSHKLVFSFVAWLIYATILIGQSRYGWRGKRLLRLSILAFFCLIVGYFGSKFVLEWLAV